MANFSRIFLVFLGLFSYLLVPTQASDVLRLDDSFRALDLTPYMKHVGGNDYEFSLQNGASQPLNFVLHQLPPPKLLSAFGVGDSYPTPLRLFSSNDHEFAAIEEQPNVLQFHVPANQVQSFLLTEAIDLQPVYLWSPSYFSSYQSRLYTVQLSLLLLLATLVFIAVIVAALRRSRRGAYAVVMAGGLIALQGSLWGDDLAQGLGTEIVWLTDNDWLVLFAFALGLAMTGIGHLNLLIRKVINRNYWTRVIIFADICLIATASTWTLAVIAPRYAGLMGAQIPDIALSLTIACILLGVIFLPDRRDTHLV